VTSEITDHHITVAGEIRGLQQAGIVALRAEWRRLFGDEPPRLSRDLLVRALAYRVQERAMGGLSRANLKRLRELADNPEGRGPPPEQAASLRPGAMARLASGVGIGDYLCGRVARAASYTYTRRPLF
jgi:hypothetical protein